MFQSVLDCLITHVLLIPPTSFLFLVVEDDGGGFVTGKEMAVSAIPVGAHLDGWQSPCLLFIDGCHHPHYLSLIHSFCLVSSIFVLELVSSVMLLVGVVLFLVVGLDDQIGVGLVQRSGIIFSHEQVGLHPAGLSQEELIYLGLIGARFLPWTGLLHDW